MAGTAAVEAQRITAILEIATEKLAILASLTTDFQNEELTQMLGEEISRIIHEQKELEAQYEELITMRGQLKTLSNKTKSKQNDEEIMRVALALQQSTKLLCRNLQDNPNLEGNLLKIQSDRASLDFLLGTTIKELQFGRFDALHERITRTRSTWDNNRAVLEREKDLSKKVSMLREELASEKKEFESEVAQKSSMLAKLKEELQEMKSKTSIETKYLAKDAAAFIDCQTRIFNKEESDLEELVAQLDTKIKIEKRANQMTEEFLKRKIVLMGEKTEAWNARYDKDLAHYTSEFEKLKQRREADTLRLRDMEEKHKADVEEREAQAAEERRQAELQRLREAEEARQNAAAVMLQCNVRVWLAKTALDDIKHPKKKKGKGKGKGAKGGKKGKKK